MKKPDNHEKWLLVILLAALATRILLMSRGFDDFDSFQFIDAVRDTSVISGRVYVLYIVLAKLIYWTGGNMRMALILPGAVAGGLVVVPAYYVAEKFLEKKNALICALLVAFNPLMLLKSGIAMTDMLGAFFLVSSVMFLLRGKENGLAWSALMFALAGCTRYWNLAFFALVPIYFLRKDLKKLGKFAGLVALLTLVWFIPLVADLGIERAGSMFIPHEAQAREGLFADAPYSIPQRVGVFLYGSAYLNSMNPVRFDIVGLLTEYPTLQGVAFARFMTPDLAGALGLVLVLTFWKYAAAEWRKLDILLVWLVPFFLWLMLMQTPFNYRYQVPLVVPCCVIIAKGFERIEKRRVAGVLVSLLFVLWLSRGVGLAHVLQAEAPAFEQEIEYVVKEYGDTVPFVGYGQGMYFRHYQPSISYIEAREMDSGFGVIPDGALIDKRVAERLGIQTEKCRTFSREPMAHFKDSVLTVCEAQ